MSNGIGHVWAVNAEGGDQGRPNGVGPVWIENADQLGTKLPEPESGDAGKVLKVDSNGDPEWATGDVQADWTESDPSDPSYVQNKPDVLSFVAGSGISITESASSITIAADAQIPSYNTTTDVGKVLQVTANGLEWVSLS